MSVTRPPVPLDDALPAMPRMLDVDAMAPVLERSLGGAHSIDSVTIRYLRYKQGRSLLVRYEVGVAGATHGVVALAEPEAKLAQRAERPANVELAAKAADRTPARAPLAYEDDPGILVQWTPVDLALPAMAEPPQRLRQILEDAGVRTRVQGELPQLVHFKPNRRAVLRYGDHFVKIYADDRAYERAVAGMLAANALPMRSARCEAAIPELRLTAQSFVEGAPPAGPVEAAPAAGAFLAMLHGTPNDTVRVTPPSHRLESATASVRLLASIAPQLEQRLEALLRRLEEQHARRAAGALARRFPRTPDARARRRLRRDRLRRELPCAGGSRPGDLHLLARARDRRPSRGHGGAGRAPRGLWASSRPACRGT